MTVATRWAGAIAAVANTFLSQELVRIVLDHMDRVSEGQHLEGGWMRLSSAAWPATWVFWASHIWLAAVASQWLKAGGQRVAIKDGLLLTLVSLEIILIHAVVLMLRGSWQVEPALLW